jgi:uncharacterized protein
VYNANMTSKRQPLEKPIANYRGAKVPLRVIRHFARQIAKRFQPEKIILFGSHAYGTPHADSDVDILVVMPARNQHDQAVRIRWEIPAPFPVDLIVRTPKNLGWRLEEGELFHTEIDTSPWARLRRGGCYWCRTRIVKTRCGLSVSVWRVEVNERTMKMATSPDDTEDDLQPEYDFRTMRGVVRGKYAERYRERLRVIRLADDVAEAFADEAAVNEALREYLRNRPSLGGQVATIGGRPPG